jgi:hypothetical protein
VVGMQRDQIGRIFAYWAVCFLGQILKITAVAQNFGFPFSMVEIIRILILVDYIPLSLGRNFEPRWKL